jgi:hypothetical protein
MSKSSLVSCYAGRPRPDYPARPDPQREIWVYDAAMALVLAQVIRTVESLPSGRRPGWWAAGVLHLRAAATIQDLGLALDSWTDAAERREFAALLEEAADQLGSRGAVTAEEAAAWIVLDDLPVMFRGDQPVDTKPVAELGRALAALLRGPLYPPPPGMWWYYGWPGGRTTVPMRDIGADG